MTNSYVHEHHTNQERQGAARSGTRQGSGNFAMPQKHRLIGCSLLSLWTLHLSGDVREFKPGFIFKKFDIRNQTLNWKVPTRNKKMAESAEENPLSYTRIWVYWYADILLQDINMSRFFCVQSSLIVGLWALQQASGSNLLLLCFKQGIWLCIRLPAAIHAPEHVFPQTDLSVGSWRSCIAPPGGGAIPHRGCSL